MRKVAVRIACLQELSVSPACWLCTAMLCCLLGICHAEPVEPRAVSLTELSTAAEAGDPVAQRKLADAYAGLLDSTNAFQWYQRAAQAGDAQAQWQLGRHYEFGVAKVRVDLESAMAWYLKAATQNCANAQSDLGQLFERGISGPPDLVEAYKWYTIAVTNRSAMARIHRDRLAPKLTPDQITEGMRRAEDFLRAPEVAAEVPTPTQAPENREPQPAPPPAVVAAEQRVATPAAPVPTPAPDWLAELQLRGIAALGKRRSATINQRNVFEGESAAIPVNGRTVNVRCVRITETCAWIQFADIPGTFQLTLSR